MRVLQELANEEAKQISEWEQKIEALVREKGGNCNAVDFQHAVNIIFHDVEAGSYDKVHLEMWQSLQLVFDTMSRDILEQSPATDWTLADVGCGTGLATDLLLQSPLGSSFSRLKMVDTSEEMLKRCRARAEKWRLPTDFICSQIDTLPDQSVNMVVTCSVLHHLPGLVDFCRQLERVIKPGGVYLHVHDPRRSAYLEPLVIQRSEEYLRRRKQDKTRLRMVPLRLAKAAIRNVRRLFAMDYLDEVNRRLIDAGLIKMPLAPREIWSITDLRHGDLPYSAIDGISSAELSTALPRFLPITIRTHGFYGVLPSNLPSDLAKQERRFFEASSLEGMFISGAWRRQSE